MIIALLSPSELVSWLEGRQVHCGSTEAEQLQCGGLHQHVPLHQWRRWEPKS